MSCLFEFSCFCLFSLLFSVNALFEDQVGKFDWKQSYVGRAKFSLIDTSTDSIFLATEENVVASVDLKDGRLLWRKVLEDDSQGTVLALGEAPGGHLVTLAGFDPPILRVWDKATGRLVSERVHPPNSDPISAEWSVGGGGGGLHEAALSRAATGKSTVLSWWSTWDLKSAELKEGSVTKFVEVISNASSQSDAKLLLYQDRGIVLLPNLEVLGFEAPSHLDDSAAGLKRFTGRLPGSLDFEKLLIRRVASPSLALLVQAPSSSQYIITFPKDGSSQLIVTEIPGCENVAVRDIGSELTLVCIAQDRLEYSSLTGSSQSLKSQAWLGLPPGRLLSLASTSPSLFSSDLFLYLGDEDSLSLLEIDEVRWTREEALANIITAEMVDLPVSQEEAAIEKEFANKEVDMGLTSGIIGMFVRRLQSQFLQGVNFVVGLLKLGQGSEDSVRALRKDQFGLKKLIILVTKSSKVFGMESERGEIIWYSYIPGELSAHSLLGRQSVPFYLLRNSRHFHLPPIASLVFNDITGKSSIIYSFNPINGERLVEFSSAERSDGLQYLGYKLKQIVQLPEEDEAMTRGLVLVSDEGRVRVWPESSLPVALECHRSLYMFTVEPRTGLIEGYAFPKVSSTQLGLLRLWNVRLGADSIVSIGLKNKMERVHSQGRVLSDRSVLYKYINPHLIAVATHTSDSQVKNVVTVYLIDSVSGAVVFSTVHKRAAPPVYMVHSENWLVYSIFNDKSRRTELISLDLYEGKAQRNNSEYSSVSGGVVEPMVERQAYIFPHNIQAMRETITEKGITNKHVLVGVSTGSVLEVPWALLDPHRSPEGSREEGVIPYSPDLSLPHEAYLTYNHTLPRISGIHTSPSGLESTSLTLTYGLDLFYTRVSPSKTFDVLKDDFEYWLITLVLGGLISAAYITKKLASRKALKQAWK